MGEGAAAQSRLALALSPLLVGSVRTMEGQVMAQNPTPTLLPGNSIPERYCYYSLLEAITKAGDSFIRCGNHTTAQVEDNNGQAELHLFIWQRLCAILRPNAAVLFPQGSESPLVYDRIRRVCRGYGYDFFKQGKTCRVRSTATDFEHEFSYSTTIQRVTPREATP